MIISNGTIAYTYIGVQTDDFIQKDTSTKRSAGGRLKSSTSGIRFVCVDRIRITGAELQELTDLLNDGSFSYYYTPSVIPDYLSAADFPMEVVFSKITKTRHAGGGGKIYFVELAIEGVNYL